MKAYTDSSQSKKLAEILPLESADHHYVRKVTDFRGNPVDGEWSYPKYGNPDSKYANYIVQNFTSYEKLPCWSLAVLLSVIPKHIKNYNVLRIDISDNDFAIWYDEIGYGVNNDLPNITMESAVDACYEMIIKLHKLNLL